MAIRKPSINALGWLYQDFLYSTDGTEELRYIQVKYDGEVYERVSQTFDYSNPPYSNSEQRGGSIVAQLDYSIVGQTVTIYSWEVNWRDEWPLRLAVNYLTQCLYPGVKGYAIRVAADQVYNQAGEAIDLANNSPYAFWASEQFFPLSNRPDDYLVLIPANTVTIPTPIPSTYSVSVSPNPARPGDILYVTVETDGVPLGTTIYWKISGPGVTPSFFQSGVTSGKIKVGT